MAWEYDYAEDLFRFFNQAIKSLRLLDADGAVAETNAVHFVADEVSARCPLWKTERTAETLDFGEWTADYDAATNKVARADGAAYTLVNVQGSLWCPDCVRTEANFLDLADETGLNRFCAWAKARQIALVAADIPNFNGPDVTNRSGATLFTREAYMVGGSGRSGRAYLSRKAISDEDAQAALTAFHHLASANTAQGGFHRPEDRKANRTGVPIFVLVRKDGTVAGRFTRFAAVSPTEADRGHFGAYVQRIEELIARDGEAAECILLYNGSDIFTAKWMIEHTEPNENMTAAEQSAVRYQDMNRLNRMVDYCTKPGCLRAFILRYFGENAAQDCGHCSACCGARYGKAEEIARQRRRGADGAHLGQQATAEKVGSIGKIEAPTGGDLFEQLRQVRLALSKLYHVAPFIICSDATLTSMVRRKPETLEGMRSVSGMGEIKTARYGEAFLGVIRPYVAQERKMKANVKLLAERAQSAAFRNPVRTAPKPMPPKPVYTPPPAPVIPDIDWDNLSDPEVLSDAYLSGLTIREMSQKSGLSESWLREKLRSMDLIF